MGISWSTTPRSPRRTPSSTSWVDERRVEGSHFLHNGQTIRLGQTRWKVEITGGMADGSTQIAAVPKLDV
jgi:hypothetical protein